MVWVDNFGPPDHLFFKKQETIFKMKYTLLIVPFPGFYGGSWDNDTYYAEQDALNELVNKYGITLVDDWEAGDGWESDERQRFANLYAEQYMWLIEEYLGITFECESDTAEIDSPRYYNYDTDRLFVNVKFDKVKTYNRIYQLMKDCREELAAIIKENHTSHSGFISFMSNDINDWTDEAWANADRPYFDYMIGYLLHIYMRRDSKNRHYDKYDFLNNYILEGVYYEFSLTPPTMIPRTDDAKEEYERLKEEYEQKEIERKAFLATPALPGLE